MGLARGRGRGKGRGGLLKPKSRGIAVKPPPLLGRPAPPPPMALRPRGLPVPPLLPRMRPPPPGLRPSRGIPHTPPPLMLGPGRPLPPPFQPPPPLPPPHGPPLMPLRPPMPPQTHLRPRGPLPMHGGTYSTPMSSRGKFGGKRGGGIGVNIPKGGKYKGKGKKNEFEDSEINKPWVTEAMKGEIQKKHRLFQKAKKSNAQSDWDEFKEQRNRVTTMIREAKLEYIGSHPEEGTCSKDGSHYCETCDKSFRSEELLAEHLSEHKTCGLDGCQFTAHAAVVMRHVEMQHITGLYSKIKAVTDTPEDIAKWIAERKKRYPTKENIEKQKKEREERMKRGERLEDRKTRFNPDFSVRRGRTNELRGTLQKGSQKFRGKRHASGTDSTDNTKPAKMKYAPRKTRAQISAKSSYDTDEENKNRRGKLPAFLGTVAFSHGNEESEDEEEEKQKKFSDDEWNASQENEGPTASVSTALSNIMGMYASGASDSEGEESHNTGKNTDVKVVEKNAEKIKTEILPGSSSKAPDGNEVSKSSVTNDSEGSGPEEVPIGKALETVESTEKQPEIEDQQQPVVQSNGRKRKRFHRQRAGKRKFEGKGESEQNAETSEQPQAPRQRVHLRRKRLTLLEKLLSSEIRHERNIMLQCVRYVVNENFFDAAADVQKSQEGMCLKGEDKQAEEKQSICDRILRNLQTIRQCNRYVVGKNFFGVPCNEGIKCDEDKDD